MLNISRICGTLLLCGLSMIGASLTSLAADYPNQTVRLIVPFPPGGATDIIARIVGQKLSLYWNQPVIVENVAGATGAIGAARVARAKPDGYTLLIGTASVNAVLPSVRSDLGFDTLTDFSTPALLATFPNILVVRSDLAARNVKELVALLKANPGKYTFASSGVGSSVHLAGELFKLQTHTEMTHVPYKGSAPATVDLLAGHVDMMFDNLANVISYVKNGNFKALGVCGLDRSRFLPDVPAIAEDIPDFEANSWVGILSPIGTPPDIVERVAEAAHKALQEADVKQALESTAAEPGTLTTTQFAKFLKQDVERWRNVVAEAHLTVE